MAPSTIDRLLASKNPPIVLKTRLNLLDEPADSARVRKLRKQVKDSPDVRRLLSIRKKDGTFATPPYKKWQGPHWTLISLAELGYPSGDRSLMPLRDQLYDWLFEKKHVEFPRSQLIPG